jgi:hypothetical protein
MWYLLREYPWIRARFERCWIGSHQGLCIKSEAFSGWLVTITTQYNVTLTLVLRGEIIVAQSIDTGVTHIKRRLTEGDPKVNYFTWIRETLSGSRIVWWFQRTMVYARRYLMKLTLPNIPSTQAAQRCITI